MTKFAQNVTEAIKDVPVTLYLINPTSIAKPNAIEQLCVDLQQFNVNIAVITETWLKKTSQIRYFYYRWIQSI